jgi:hypothetical protein
MRIMCYELDVLMLMLMLDMYILSDVKRFIL